MAPHSVDYLTRLLSMVADFEDAFEDWIRTQVESDHGSSRGLFPTVWTKDNQDPLLVRELSLKVAESAGAAAAAVTVTGAYVAVAGVGAIDPIANWALMSAPKALVDAHDVRTTAANVKGRLRAMILEAESASDSEIPSFAPARLHPVVRAAAAAHWTTHQYRVSVREAAEALTVHWKAKLGRNDVDDTVFWQQTLSPVRAATAHMGRPR